MACLINSIDELPKVIEGIPDDAEDFDAFFGAYTILANGKEILYDHAAYENSWYIYFVPKDESISGQVMLLCELPSKEVFTNGNSGYFETLTSLSMCEKGSEEQTICGTPICDDGKEPFVITPTSTKLGNEYAGTSDKAKPTGVPQYSLYLELDTGKFYYYDNGEWNEMPCSGGGGGGIPTPKITVTWKLDGILPSGVGYIEFFGIVEESGGEYVEVFVANPETSEGVVSGLCCPYVGGDDLKLMWVVGAIANDRNNPAGELTVAYSDFINCEDDDNGGVIITDTSSPAAFTATISNS